MSAETDPQPTSGGTLWLALSAVAFGLMYLYWPTASFVEAEDSTTFFTEMLEGTSGFHPNHLLFEPIYLWAMTLFSNLPPLLVVQSLTAVFALLGLLAVYLLIAPRKGWVPALLATWLVATTFGYWHYGKVVDAYVPALACALWALVLYDRHGDRADSRLIVPMALILSLGVLFHQLYIVLAFLICIALLFGERGVQGALIFTGIGIVVVGGAYLLAFLSLDAAAQDRGFISWSLGRADAGLWDPPGSSTPVKAAMGIIRVFVHISAFFGVEAVVDAARGAIGMERLVEEIYLAQTALFAPLTFLLPLLVLLYAVALLVLIPGGLPALARLGLTPVDRLLIAAILVYTVLVLIWEASNNEFWIHIIAFVFMLFAATFSTSRFRLGTTAAAIAAAAIVNFAAGIFPLSDPRNDYWAVMRAGITEKVPEGRLVVADCTWLCRKYLRMTDHRYYFISSFDVYEQRNGIDAPTPEEPFYLTSWALNPTFGTPPNERAQREENMARLTEAFGPLPETGPRAWTDPPLLWKWDGSWQAVD